MALLCLANTPLPVPWVQWLEGEPERLPVRLQTPYVAASGPLPSGEFVPPAAAVAAAVSATGKAVGDELGRHSSAAVVGGSVPEGGAAALQEKMLADAKRDAADAATDAKAVASEAAQRDAGVQLAGTPVSAAELESWGLSQVQYDLFNAPSFEFERIPEVPPPPPVA